jgi:type IV secretion system protein VirB11
VIAGQRTLRLLLAPVSGWLDDSSTTEVVVNEPETVLVERAGEWTANLIPEFDFERLCAIGTLAAGQTGQDIGPDRPLCATTLPDGQRVQVCLPPAVSPRTVSLTIRRPSAFQPTVQTLAARGLFDAGETSAQALHQMRPHFEAKSWPEFLSSAVLAHQNILVAGATGSGKTTLASALIRAIPPTERIVTIEDTAEWNGLPHKNRVALFYSKGDQGTARVRSEDLLEASLRMRPDRVLMQELRDGAAFTYLRGVAAGHPGSITTIHAGSARGAFDALRLMVRQNPAGAMLADADMRSFLMQMVDVVVHCERQGNRFGISEIWWKEAEHVAPN